MAHQIIGVDLGSREIKIARFEASYRKVSLIDGRTLEVPLAARPESEPRLEERLVLGLAAVGQLIAGEYKAEEIALGLPADALTFRIVDLPFATPRQIEQTLPYELESMILSPVEDMVVDFVVVGPARATGGGPSMETRVLAACAPRALIARLVKAAQELGLPLRSVGASALAFASYLGTDGVAPVVPAPLVVTGSEGGGGAEAAAPVLPGQPVYLPYFVVDCGAESTVVCALRAGRAEFARSIGRGGRHVTQAIGAAFQLEGDKAEAAKIDAGFVAHSKTPRLTPSQAHMDSSVREALAPLLRELRQTLAAYRAAYGEEPARILLAGGGARLAGLPEYLGEELGIPTEGLPWRNRAIDGWTEGGAIAEKRELMATAIGLGAATAVPGFQVNFRKGEFSYRSDYSFIRDKALYFAVAASIVLVFAGLDAWVSWNGLNKEHEALLARLRTVTTEVFGKPRTDAANVSDELKAGPKGQNLPVPSTTAFDLLDEISKMVPAGDKIRLDILDLDIRPKKTQITATTETAQQVDDLADALRKVECFDEVSKGKLTTVSVPAPFVPPDQQDKDKEKEKDNRPTELKQVTITVKTSCP